ncbi:MAG TPA: ATP-binding protein [Streptosporangiaceae bacterium]|nr:ATP-binding protein [Streptosporangiaceae bacterium]
MQSVAFSAGTGKSHLLVALGVAAVQAGHKVRYYTAAELTETLYRGLADNSVGRVIDTLLRNDLILIDEVGFAPLDDTGAQLLFRVVAAAYERRALRAELLDEPLASPAPATEPAPWSSLTDRRRKTARLDGGDYS